MKKNELKTAVAVLITASLVMMGGCKNDNTVELVSTMGAPSVSAIQKDFGTRPVADKREAAALFSDMYEQFFSYYSYSGSSLTSVLGNVIGEAFDESFKAAYGKSMSSWQSEQLAQTSASYSVSINDSLKLAKGINDNIGSSAVTAATIKGSSKASVKSSKPLAVAYSSFFSSYSAWEEGDNLTASTSSNMTIDISKGFVEKETSGKKRKLAGIIKTNSSGKTSEKLKDKANEIYDTSTSSTSKVAACLAYSDGEKGAIFRFSIASTSSNTSRRVKSDGSSDYSNVEVYDADGRKLFDFNDNSTGFSLMNRLADLGSAGLSY